MDHWQMLLVVMVAIGAFVGLRLGKRNPELQRNRLLIRLALYLSVILAVGIGYIGAMAYPKNSWWLVSSLLYLIIAIRMFVRLRKTSRSGH